MFSRRDFHEYLEPGERTNQYVSAGSTAFIKSHYIILLLDGDFSCRPQEDNAGTTRDLG